MKSDTLQIVYQAKQKLQLNVLSTNGYASYLCHNHLDLFIIVVHLKILGV